MVAVYGSIPESGPSRLATTASQSRRRRAAIVVGLAAGAAAALVIAVAAISSPSASVLMGEGAEVYKDKRDELRGVEGGAWMQCMRCRHASKLCHPSRGERVGRVPFRTNACPPHAGMVTVSVKRHGKVALEWVDKEWLKRGQNSTNEGAEGGDEPSEKDKEEDKEEEGKGGDEGSVLCVKPPRDADAKHSWNASSDCMSVKEWIEKMDYSSGGYPYTPEEEGGGEGEGGGSRRRLLEEDGNNGEGADKEEDEEEKSPFQKWYAKKIDKIYEESYGSGADGNADGDEEDKADDDKEDKMEKPKKSPPRKQTPRPPLAMFSPIPCVISAAAFVLTWPVL
jgi:hypothetical protein